MKRLSLCVLLLASFSLTHAQLLSDTVDLAAFMDGVMQAQFKRKQIVGGTVAVVKEGKIILAKGYGFSDVKNQTPVSPDSTLFRIGSISKMFVCTSVMQLVAQGKLELDRDINFYLRDFKIPEAYDKPVTLKHLMTHTPGFEDHVLGLFGKDSSTLKPLGTILKDEMPDRVRPPYTHASYSNHGTGIAAHIVELISGLTFHEYVEKNILQPLNMSFTTFRQPLPAHLKNYMSAGYRQTDLPQEQSFEFVPLYAVGAASSSAVDMTHFMLAFLQNGTYNNYQMLDSATLVLMESPAHQHHPAVNPMRYGFMDLSQNGETVIGHGGDTFWFHSLMALLPEHGTGLFVSFNTNEGGGVYLDVLDAFMDRYFPDKQELKRSVKVNKKWLERFEGEYMGNRYPHDDITKISSLFGRVKISVVDSTRLKLSTNDEATIYIPVDTTTFLEEFKSDKIAFAKDEAGEIRYLFLGGLPILAFEKVNALQNSTNHTLLFVWVGLITLIALIYWPLVYNIRKHYQPHLQAKTPLPVGSKIIAWFNYLLLLIFLVGLMFSLGDPIGIVYGVPASLKVLLVLPFVVMFTTLLMIISFFRMTGNGHYGAWSRVYYFILCTTSILALWQLYYWNFVGFNY